MQHLWNRSFLCPCNFLRLISPLAHALAPLFSFNFFRLNRPLASESREPFQIDWECSTLPHLRIWHLRTRILCSGKRWQVEGEQQIQQNTTRHLIYRPPPCTGTGAGVVVMFTWGYVSKSNFPSGLLNQVTISDKFPQRRFTFVYFRPSLPRLNPGQNNVQSRQTDEA